MWYNQLLIRNSLRFGGRCKSTISCEAVLSAPYIAVLRLKSAGIGKDLSGHVISITESDGNTQNGVVMLQRFPLLFVYGIKRVINNTNITVSQLNKHIFDPSLAEYSSDTIMVNERLIIATPGGAVPLLESIPDAAEVQLLTKPLHTGVSAIDVLTPMGCGQNMLLVGTIGAPGKDMLTDCVITTLLKNSKDKMTGILVSSTKNSRLSSMQSLVHINDPNINNQLTVNFGDKTRRGDLNYIASCARLLFQAHAACSVGNWYRQNGSDAIVALDFDFAHLENFWNFSTECLNQYVYGGVDGGFLNNNVNDKAGSSSEKRFYYASLFQQVGKLIDSRGSGSMTLICRINRPAVPKVSSDTASVVDGDEHVVYTEADFSLFPKKITDRLKALTNKGISLTPAVLKKLAIPLPSTIQSNTSTVPSVAGAVADIHVQARLLDDYIMEIKSHTDGQIVFDHVDHIQHASTFNTTLHEPAVIPHQSLSRVGGGTEKRRAGSQNLCEIPIIKLLTNQLRGELSQVNDIMASDNSEEMQLRRIRALSWMCAMEQDVTKEGLSLMEQVVRFSFVHHGFYDGLIRYIIQQHQSVDWSQLKKILFTQYDIKQFNEQMVQYCKRQCGDQDFQYYLNNMATVKDWLNDYSLSVDYKRFVK